jgi:hypothetical protein
MSTLTLAGSAIATIPRQGAPTDPRREFSGLQIDCRKTGSCSPSPRSRGIGIYTAYPVLSKGILAASVLR